MRYLSKEHEFYDSKGIIVKYFYYGSFSNTDNVTEWLRW